MNKYISYTEFFNNNEGFTMSHTVGSHSSFDLINTIHKKISDPVNDIERHWKRSFKLYDYKF